MAKRGKKAAKPVKAKKEPKKAKRPRVWDSVGKLPKAIGKAKKEKDKPVHLAKAAGGTYRLPAKLQPEKDYMWTVTVAGNEVGSARFRTLSSEALAQIERRKPSDKADFSDRLLFTLMLQEMGAVQEAREAWAKLAQERADLPELAAFAK